MSNASNLSTLANVLDDGSDGQFLKSTGSGGVAFDTVAAGAVVYATADLLPLSGNSAGDMAYVTATNRFYINNGSGWYSVSLVNTNPNITSVQDASSNTTPFTLATDGTATVITVTAADPEEVPLTYGYSVTSGSLNGSTVAQGTGSNTNVFTVTPHASNDATFIITFTASDGINQATSANAFSLSFITTVTDSKYTTLLATAISTGVGYNFSSFGYDSVTQSTGRSGNNEAIRFNNNGTKMYIVSDGGPDGVYQYSLSTAYDITSASYDNVSFSVTQDSSPRDLHFNANGTKMFILGTSNRAIYQYTLSTAYDLSTASYDNVSLSIAYASSMLHFHFNGDGTKIYVGSSANPPTIYERNLAGAYNISSETSSSTFMYNESDLPSGYTEAYAHSGIFNDDGTKMYLLIGRMPDGSRAVIEYDLSTAYSLSTISRTAIHALNNSNAGNDPRGFTFNGDGTKLLILDETNPIYRMNTTGAFAITDSSSNPHSITVNGDTFPGTFSPYRSGGYSTSFDGSNDYLKTPSSDFYLSTGQFSAEVWIKPSDLSGNKLILMDTNYNLYTYNTQVKWYTNTAYVGNAGSDILSVGKWTHLLVTRDSNNTLRIFADGILLHVTTNHTYDYGTSNTAFELSYSGGNKFAGEMRDARVISGSIPSDYQTSSTTTTSTSAVITVPTEPLTAVSGTKFLGGHLPYLGYTTASTTGYFNIIGGNPSTKPFSPYDYTEYSATDHGGSVYFDGNGDTIGTYHASNLQLGASSAFTLEFWFYANGTSSDYQSLFSTYSGSSVTDAGQSARLIFNTSNNLFIFTDGSSNFLQITKDVPQNVWNHFCWTRDASNNHKFYLNGEQIGTSTTSTNFQTDWWYFAQRKYNGDQEFTGYISDISLIKGSVTRSSAFTPPTAPLSSSGTSLHIKGTDASIIDKSQGTNIDLGSTSIVGHSTTKWSGENSIYINSHSNNSDIITIPAGVLDASEPFTIEMWLKTLTGSASGFWSIYQDASNIMRLKMRGDDRLEFYHRGSGASAQEILDVTNTYTLNNADFYHVAITRDSNSVFYLHQNGIKLGNFTANGDYDSLNTPFIIGKSQPATERYMNGYIQDFRITQGLARYTADDESANIPSAPLEG